MRIENDVKLDFKDVLIRPKRSTLTTRSQVDISREFRFRHTGTDYAGIPIVASNMDSTGTIEMARALGARVEALLDHGHFPVLLGGGHEIAWGSFQGASAALARDGGKRLCVLALRAAFQAVEQHQVARRRVMPRGDGFEVVDVDEVVVGRGPALTRKAQRQHQVRGFRGQPA